MSRMRFNKVAAPSSPAANKAEIYYDSGAPGVGTNVKFVAIDESGNKMVLGGFATKDYRCIKVTELFNGTVTYTPTNGAQALWVEAIAGGGAGGGVATAVTNAGAAGGGGSGGYSAKWITGTLKTSYTVAIGAGGTPGSAGANPGGTGAVTTFDTGPVQVQANAGVGGGADTVAVGPRVAGAGGAGGAVGTGDIAAPGGAGGTGLALAAAQAISGAGAAGNPMGAIKIPVTAQGAGQTGNLYGGGGSGGCILSGGASVAGGAGANGILIITEFA